MDSLIAAAARALVAGDALGALKHVALREDAQALALRGIAMAQLGELPRARELLRRAARGFASHDELARARCVVAEAEVALAMRELRGWPRALAAASAPAPSSTTSSSLIFFKASVSVSTKDTRWFQVIATCVGSLPWRMCSPTSSMSSVWRA